MNNKISEQIKIDPSESLQDFKDLNIKLFCCRYWVLEEWECNDLKVPFWRMYHNSVAGSTIKYKNQTIALNQQTILLIPPNTLFSSQLKRNQSKGNESIKGRSFVATDHLEKLKETADVDHLFIHFSLGYPMDFVNNNIYQINCNQINEKLLLQIQDACITNTITSFRSCLLTKQLLHDCLLQLPNDIWEPANLDFRILKSIKFIEANFNEKITNSQLSDAANMATNSFARLFKIGTGVTTQQYILKLRVQAACNFMHHSNKSMDEIAFECGFSDRHHFSKIFKKIQKINPSDYKKRLKTGSYYLINLPLDQ
ncbi:AraC-like DNA-binding protein [Pedobacter sp. CG_S7]|uniref:AraC family transcriptional regulator n=1 Tax=Pedobacter sp. CG_S7 TaxID=3143930 RepID=UPI003395CE30